MTKVKICGVQRIEDVEYLNAAKPDYAGFVFARSRRQITKEQAITLRMSLDEDIPAVGVFVNELPKVAGYYGENNVVDLIQLHGQEDERYLSYLRQYTACEIIQAFPIQTEDDIRRAGESSADYILLDNKTAGSGECFDWSLIGKVERPFFLAGGLNQENIAEAIEHFHPFALDISSGVETDGYKDKEKIEMCVRRIRNV